MTSWSFCTVLLALLVTVQVNAMPSSAKHEIAHEANHAATKGNTANKAQETTAAPASAKPSVISPIANSNKAKPPVNLPLKTYKLHAGGLSKRNENSIMKREQLYSDPPGAAFTYFRRDDSDRRRRSPHLEFATSSLGRFPGVISRSKRDLPSRLDADDALALLALWASAASPPHRLRLGDTDYRYDLPELQEDELLDDELQHPEQEQISDAGWVGEDEYGDRLNVMRRAGPALYPLLPSYQRRNVAPELGWGEFAPQQHVHSKRFMVSKRRAPQNDVYSLAQMLSDRYEPSYINRGMY